jgi:hypothetical protein
MGRVRRDARYLHRATIPPPRAGAATRLVPTAAVMAGMAVIAATAADRRTAVPRREDRMAAAVIRRPRRMAPLAVRTGVPARTGVRVRTAARMEAAAVLTEAIAKHGP